MQIILCGSQTFTNYPLLCKTMDRIASKIKGKITILSGHASGADRLGEQWTFERLLRCLVFHAEWDKHGNKRAGMLRNLEMLEQLDPKKDGIVAFWDGKSPGTKGMLDMARKKGIKRIKIVRFSK